VKNKIILILLLVSLLSIRLFADVYGDESIPMHVDHGKLARLNPNLRNSKLIKDVPAYKWSFGCAPTCAAMLVGYYDRNNFDNLWEPYQIQEPMWQYNTFADKAPLTNAEWTRL